MVDQKESQTLQDKPETIKEIPQPQTNTVCKPEDIDCNKRWIDAFSDCV
jgi:hypothetical protein